MILQKILALAFVIIIVKGFTVESPTSPTNILQNPRNLQAIQIDSATPESSESPLTPKISPIVFQKKTIENRSFANLVVYHDIPTTLSNKQLYTIRGRVINPSDKPEQNFVRFILKNTETQQSFRRTQYLSAGFFEFNILLDIRHLSEGRYTLDSEVGTAKGKWTKEVQIVSYDQSKINSQVAPPRRPKNLKIEVVNYELILTWKEDTTAAISKIQIFQGGRVRSYTITNSESRFNVPFRDFADFEADTVTVTLWNAYSDSSSLSGRISSYSRPVQIQFKASARKFMFYEEAQLTLTKTLPLRVRKGEKFAISATGLSTLENRFTIQTPLNTFRHEWFQPDKQDQPNVPENVNYQKSLLLTEEGVYVIEIRNALGNAVLVWPVIVGDSYPFLPYYYDFIDEENTDRNAKPGQPEGLQEQRIFFLGLVNQKRAEFNVSPLALDDKLNQFAHNYAEQMIKRNHFYSINMAGLGPQQRAIKAGIKVPVRQLLGYDANLTLLANYLFVLPTQLQTLVSEEWKTTGLGLPKDADGNFVASLVLGGRDYATVPLTKPQIVYYRIQLASIISVKYPRILEENKRLSTLVSEWQNANPLFKSLYKLESYLARYGFPGSVIKTITITLQPNFIDIQLSRSPLIIPPNLSANKIGIGMKQVEGYSLEIIIAYH